MSAYPRKQTLALQKSMSAKGQKRTFFTEHRTGKKVLKKAKAAITAKMENAAAAEFVDAKRAIRKNTLEQPIDTSCGHVKGKKPPGERRAPISLSCQGKRGPRRQ